MRTSLKLIISHYQCIACHKRLFPQKFLGNISCKICDILEKVQKQTTFPGPSRRHQYNSTKHNKPILCDYLWIIWMSFLPTHLCIHRINSTLIFLPEASAEGWLAWHCHQMPPGPSCWWCTSWWSILRSRASRPASWTGSEVRSDNQEV